MIEIDGEEQNKVLAQLEEGKDRNRWGRTK